MPDDTLFTDSDSVDRHTIRLVGPGEALLFFVFLIPVFLLGGTLLQSWRLVEGTIATEWLLILLPMLIFIRVRAKSISASLRVAPPTGKHIAGSVILALSAIPLVAELAYIQDRFFPIPDEFLEMMKEAFTLAEDQSAALAFFAFCITPAVCEEALFRGFLLNAFRRRTGTTAAVLVTSILFGLFHVNFYRFLPTAIIGSIIAIVVLSSSSLVPGIIYHAINNAVALAVLNLPWLGHYPWLLEESHIPVSVLSICSVGFLGGIIVLRSSPARQRKSET